MICQHCSKELRDDANFCTGCGKAIPRCPTCGKVLTKRARFCTSDGTPIPADIIALIPENTAQPPVIKPDCKAEADHTQTKPVKKKSGRSKVVITIAVVLVLALILVCALVVIKTIIEKNSFFDPTENQTVIQDNDSMEEDNETTSETEDVTDPPQETEAVTETTPNVLMPNCVGKYFSNVENIITDMDCIPEFEYVFSSDIEKGYILEQSIPANDTIETGSTITFIVSKGPDVSPDGYNQKVVVTAGSGSSNGTLTLCNWENGAWVSAFTCTATVGKNGISSNYGEGKGRSPEGIFKLGVALSANTISNSTWPFYHVSADTCVVDDTDSQYYNTIQSISSLPSGVSYDPIGKTLTKGSSNICIYIEHNGNGYSAENVVPGKGSVITICGKSDSLSATAGCIDISSSNMNTLISMLDYSKNPHIEICVS